MSNSLQQRFRKRLYLDLGSSAARLCEISQTRNGLQLTKYHQHEFGIDPSMSEEDRLAARVTGVKELMKKAKVRRGRKVYFAVPGQSVFTRTRPLPPVPEYKVTQIVRYEIQQQIPFSLDQIAMDYQILARNETGGFEVMMAAIKVDVVEKQLEVLREAKLNIDVVDVCPLASYNWLKHTGEFGEEGECVALIDIGAATTDIVIERGGMFRFTRPLNIGGNDVTKTIASEFGMNWSDAEKAKRQRGSAPTGDPKRDGKSGEVVGRVLQRLTGEIMRSFAYFRSLPGGGAVNRVVLCGGGASLRNIVPYMQRALGVQVRIAQPLAGLAVTPAAQEANENPEQSTVVLGLALRDLTPVPIAISLTPPRILEEARRREQYAAYSMLAVLILMIMASIVPLKEQENENVLQQIEVLQRAISNYDPTLVQDPTRQSASISELAQARGRVESLKSDIETLDSVRRNARFWLEEMDILNEERPSGLWWYIWETISINEQNGNVTELPDISTGSKLQITGGQGGFFVGNAVRIEGFAETPQRILDYIGRLESVQDRRVGDEYLTITNVFYDDKDTEELPLRVLLDVTQRPDDAEYIGGDPLQFVYSFVITVRFNRSLTPSNQPPPADGAAPAGQVAAAAGAGGGA